MLLPLVGRLSMKSFGLGAVAAAVAAMIARPMLVSVVRAGYEASDLATDTWEKAKAEAVSVKNDALAPVSASAVEAELTKLREEVATLRAQVANKRAS